MVSEFENEVLKRQAEDLRYDKLANAAKWNLCAECGGMLVVIWNGKDDEYQLKCGQNKAHIGTKSAWEHPRIQERNAREVAMQKDSALVKYSGTQELTERQAVEVVGTIWPGAPEVEKRKAILLCVQYKLNPLRKHLFLVPYKNSDTGEMTWEIILGITAKRQMAHDRVGAYSYVDNTPRLMTEAEQLMYVGEVEANRYWAITKLKAKDGNTAQGYGYWSKTKTGRDGKTYPNVVKGSEKGNSMQNMAMIHSESAALERLSGESMPTGVSVVDDRFIDDEIAELSPLSADGEGEKQRAKTTPGLSPLTGEGEIQRAGNGHEAGVAEVMESLGFDDVGQEPATSASTAPVGISPARVADIEAELARIFKETGKDQTALALQIGKVKRFAYLTPEGANSLISQLKGVKKLAH